jgi:hypothetical protein
VILLVGEMGRIRGSFPVFTDRQYRDEELVMAQAIQNAIATRDARKLRELAQNAGYEQRMMLQFLAEILEGEAAFSRAAN